MKAQDVRDIVFAHAIETASPNEALPNAARRDSITQEALHAIGKAPLQGSAGRQAFLQFLQARATRIIQASQLPADVRHLWQHAPGVARWAPVALLLAALALGYTSHQITDPHRVDLLSKSLIGIVLWNVAVYVWLAGSALRRLLRPRRQPEVILQPSSGPAGDAAPTASAGWLGRWQAKTRNRLRGNSLRPLALNFERNWWQISQDTRHAQWLLWLHLGAALMAVGALASLWLTGLTKEYQVGWESTFLSAAQVQSWLNHLFAPTQWLGLTQPWGLDEIQSLQGWAANAIPAASANGLSVGARWVQAYTALLAIVVVAPRLLLALWQALRAQWLSHHMQLPLNQPYFEQLRRDFGGLATHLVVQPYSLEITPERRSALAHHASTQYGAGASIDTHPTLAYGAALPDLALQAPTIVVVLINLAATPEAEIHGELLAQLRSRYGTSAQVWLWTPDFTARNAGAPRRVEERTRLWQDFATQNGLSAQLVSASSS